MTYLELVILSWCLICSTTCLPRRQSFRVYDSDGITSLYKGPVNHNSNEPPLSSYIVRSDSDLKQTESADEVYMGSKKPVWKDNPLDFGYTKTENEQNEYQAGSELLTYHDLECNPGSSIPCTQIIDIKEPPRPQIRKKYQLGQNKPGIYMEDIDNAIDTTFKSTDNYGEHNTNTFKPESFTHQLTPPGSNYIYQERHRLSTSTPSYTTTTNTIFPEIKRRYDPFTFQQNLRSRKKSRTPWSSIELSQSKKENLFERPAAIYYQQPPTYHSHYTDSRLFAPSIASSLEAPLPNPLISERRMNSFTPSLIPSSAPIMRNSITWKSSKHRDKHILSNRIETSNNNVNKNKHFVKTNDFKDYDWNLGWDDSKINRRQAYYSSSSNDNVYSHMKQTNKSPYPTRQSSYYFPTTASEHYNQPFTRPTSRPQYETSSDIINTSNENRRHYFPIRNGYQPHEEAGGYPNPESNDKTGSANGYYNKYGNDEPPFSITKDHEGFLKIEPAIVNTGYVVSDEIQPSEVDQMWSTYDERYGWTENSSKRPESYQTTTEHEPFYGKVKPIQTWTSLDVAKPEWEEQERKDQNSPSLGSSEALESYHDHNTPYGKWNTPLELHSVPFSRSADGKPIRWKLIASTAKLKDVTQKDSKKVMANSAVPLIVVRPTASTQVNPVSEKRKKTKSRRLSKRIKIKEKGRRRNERKNMMVKASKQR